MTERAMLRRETRRRLIRDRERLRDHSVAHGLPPPKWPFLHPSYLSVWLHRWSAYYYRTGRRLRARMLWHINLLATGADFAPISEVGAGLVVMHPISTQIFGRIGEDCTIWGHGGIGGGRSTADVGAGPGLPVIGDRVYFGARAMVLGPVLVGDDCELGPGAMVTRDLAPGSVVEVVNRNRSLRAAEAVSQA